MPFTSPVVTPRLIDDPRIDTGSLIGPWGGADYISPMYDMSSYLSYVVRFVIPLVGFHDSLIAGMGVRVEWWTGPDPATDLTVATDEYELTNPTYASLDVAAGHNNSAILIQGPAIASWMRFVISATHYPFGAPNFDASDQVDYVLERTARVLPYWHTGINNPFLIADQQDIMFVQMGLGAGAATGRLVHGLVSSPMFLVAWSSHAGNIRWMFGSRNAQQSILPVPAAGASTILQYNATSKHPLFVWFENSAGGAANIYINVHAQG